MSTDDTASLIGLFEDALLPGETRAFAPPSVDAATLAALAREAPPALVAVTVTSAVELPSLVSSRWCTACEVVVATDASVTLRGLARRRIRSAKGRAAPYVATLEPPLDEPLPDLVAVLPAARALLATLDAGARPDRADADASLAAALTALLRAVWSPTDQREAAAQPLPATFEKATRALAVGHRATEGSAALESLMRALIDQPAPTTAQQRRLWSQVVEIQRRLDVYDPAVGQEEGDEIGRLQRRVMQAGLPAAARDVARRELRLLRTMKTDHHDYATYLAHLDLIARLPWQSEAPRDVDLAAVRRALERQHTGLEKPKQRVLEYLAVRALGGETRSTVLCLSGPPGVGKTTIAQAMAEALGRRFVRVALGGVHDESEVRGHRISFTAACAGRIIAGLAGGGSTPVLMLLDEIDKMGTDRARSPAAAMLEVLDPAQNTHFHDNYLGVPYDLSAVLFVCTANDLSAMHPTLRDRMEVVELDGYTAPEKLGIARHHLLERLRSRVGLPRPLTVDDGVLDAVMEGYTREAGVRQLERSLEAIHRARALVLVSRDDREAAVDEVLGPPVTLDEVRSVLGPGRGARSKQPARLPVGVATGLSVSGDGGATLFVEVARLPAHGRPRLDRTGSLGLVLKESAAAALTHLRAEAEGYGVTDERLNGDFHVHLPEGGVGKDGPSAGVAIFLALLSAVRGRRVRADLAFTGEITLGGRVLPVGGVRAKVLAAERAGIRTVVVPKENLHEVPADAAVTVVGVELLSEVVAMAFEAEEQP